MTSTPKSKVFIGSSREALQIARAVQHELRDNADAHLWSQGLFRAGTVVIDELVKAVNGFDFGVFIFAPDDVLKMRSKELGAVRDNVLFELGIFVGKLGARRSIFVVPEKDTELRLPSDLAGIIPAKYDSDYREKGNTVQVAVSAATFQIAEVIQALGSLHSARRVLFDGKQHSNSRVLIPRESFIHKDHKAVGSKAEGALHFGPDGLLTIARSNSDGRFEIHVRPNGPKNPSFEKTTESRALHVSCSVKAEGAPRKIRFVAKDEKAEKWLADESRRIEPGDWNILDFYLWVDPTKDFLFRIDEEEVRGVPSKLLIRDLMIVDDTSL